MGSAKDRLAGLAKVLGATGLVVILIGILSSFGDLRGLLGNGRSGVTVNSAEYVDVSDFGAIGDADYYNSEDGNYYSDPQFQVPSTDDTGAINRAVQYASENKIERVIIPDGSYLIRAQGRGGPYMFKYATGGGIQLESHMTLEMSDHTTLVTNTVYVGGYSLITLDGKENVTIRGGRLVGDMDTHPPNTHNYCYGITIANASKNILVDGVEITKMEDDGIMIADYLEHLSRGERAYNIEIRNVKSHNNGRQGLTISTGSNIRVFDSEFSHQTKHSPMSGIDIELESYDHIGVENVDIRRNIFDGNAYSGIVFSDMFNYAQGSMSKNIAISDNEIRGSRFGVIAPGKSRGLIISRNRVEIDHLVDEFSCGIGTTSRDSTGVVIEGNEVLSTEPKNQSIGLMVMTPRTVVKGNTLSGQRVGIFISSDDNQVTDNLVMEATHLPFKFIEGVDQDRIVEGNEIR